MKKIYRFTVAALPNIGSNGRLKLRAEIVRVIEASDGTVFETKDYPKREQVEVTARVSSENTRTIVEKICALRLVFDASVLEETNGGNHAAKNRTAPIG